MMTLTPNTLTHNEQLITCIRDEIEQSKGYMSFARFMELALYAPRLGYYNVSTPFGNTGDFITAPEISPLFAQSIARQFQQILTLNSGDILEIGAGSGMFAKDLLLELEKLKSLPENYFIFEISQKLQEQQKQFLQSHCPHLFNRIQWLSILPQNFSGIIFANEVMDAMPVHCFRVDADGIKERVVTWNNNEFTWNHQPASPELIKNIPDDLPENYESEVNLALAPWIQQLAHSLKKGVILLIDYGYGRREFFHPDRTCGTLMCFYQHQRHDNPFLHVGSQDITAHVDFTTVIESAVANDLALAGYSTQSSFLLACGLLTIAEQNNLPTIQHYEQSQAIKKLTLPSQMGEVVKVIGLTKNFESPLLGFALYDRRRDL